MRPLYLAPTTLMDATPLALIQAAQTAGYDGLGLRLHPSPGLPYHPVAGNAPLIRAMKHALIESKLGLLDIYSFYLQPAASLDEFEPALALGAEFGARYALVQGADPDWPRLRDNFCGFCERAAKLGITACIEFVPQRELATLEQALALIEDSGAPNAAICIDPLHLARSGGTPADLRRLEPRLLPYIQFSDGVLAPGEPDLALAKRIGLGQRRLPGEGTLPLADLLNALPENLPLSLEVLPIPAGMPEAEWARRVIDTTRRFLTSRRTAPAHSGS